MKLCWNSLMVEDMEKSMEFYNGVLGLQVEKKFSPAKDIDIVFLAAGGAEVELICNKNLKLPAGGKGMGISMGFKVDSLDAAMELMKSRGVDIARGPIQPNPDTRFFFVKDPDGFEVQIVEQKSRG